MNKTVFLAAAAISALALTTTSCTESFSHLKNRVCEVAVEQCTLMDARLPEDRLPKTFEADTVVNCKIGDWVSGFFPGTLWELYELTGHETIKALAEKETAKLNDICEARTSHDIGFQVNCSFGNGYRLTGDEKYLPVMEKGAAKLAARYNPVVGTTRSWDWVRKGTDWKYPVIIDNMMNLELLEVASKLFGADSLATIAKNHATTTMINHFRDDYTTYHVVDYDPESGAVRGRMTHQGYSDDSAWARGQAWGLYGYTMMFRETGMAAFLDQAEKIAGMLLSKLPGDGIPYWDFNAPDIPDAFRDASAGAIMASAFAELSTLTSDPSKAASYLAMSEKQVRTLAGKHYLAKSGENGNFLLKHSVGHLPGGKEVDVPLSYADYYFLEAIVRLSKIKAI